MLTISIFLTAFLMSLLTIFILLSFTIAATALLPLAIGITIAAVAILATLATVSPLAMLGVILILVTEFITGFFVVAVYRRLHLHHNITWTRING